jgi:hypothetical protein
VAAAQNNHTIDDASPLVQKKLWDGCLLSSNCSDPAFWSLDSSRLYDHTFTPFSDVEFNFTGASRCSHSYILHDTTDIQGLLSIYS